MISAYRWKVLEPLIDRALDTDPAQRGAYFEAVSGGDVVLRTELEQLVDECERSDATLDGRLPELFPSLFEAEGWRPLPALDDRFRIERELGSGGMATVYLARDLRHERDVAIKVLRPQLAALLGTERFLAEVRVTANLRHPHILPLFDSGTADGQLYYVMPYVAGESLRDRLTREVQIPVTDALRIAREVAGALDAAHRQGVIHRDIKPENILLSDGQAFIADFGIALAATRAGGERITQTGVALGTPQYMSPEQAGGRLDVDARTDVCSLGAVLFEMLAGEPPFTGPTPQAIVAKMMASDPPSVRRVRPTVSGALDAVIRKALASVPGDRYASAGDLAQALERCGGEVVQRYQRRWPYIAAGVVALGALSGLGLLQTRRASTPAAERRVLVAAFENMTGSKALDALGAAATDNVVRGLAETGLAEVVDSRELVASSKRPDYAALRGLARKHDAARTLRGSYYAQGDSVRFELQIVDSRTGAPVAAVYPAVVSATSTASAIELLRQRVLAAFAVLNDSTFDAWQAVGRPSLYEAYQEYAAGVDRMYHYTADAPQRFARAYAMDSNFTFVLGSLSIVMGCGARDSLVRSLGARVDLLPAIDRARVMWPRANCHGWRDQQLALARQAYAAAPGSNEIAVFFATVARHNNYYRQALAAVERLGPARNRMARSYWSALIFPYHHLGMYDRELATAREALKVFPDNAELMSFEARALGALGRVDEVWRVLDEIEAVPTSSEQAMHTPIGGIVHIWIAGELHVHGHPVEARRVYERGVTWYRAHPELIRASRVDYGDALYHAGEIDEAWAVAVDMLQSDSTSWDAHWLLGRVAARRGDSVMVRRVDDWFAHRTGPYLHGDNTFERAGIAAIQGDSARANVLLKQALDEGFGVDQAVGPHNDPDFDSIRGLSAFRQLYRDKS